MRVWRLVSWPAHSDAHSQRELATPQESANDKLRPSQDIRLHSALWLCARLSQGSVPCLTEESGRAESHLGTHFGITAVNSGQPLALGTPGHHHPHAHLSRHLLSRGQRQTGAGQSLSSHSSTAVSILQSCLNCLLPQGLEETGICLLSAQHWTLIPKPVTERGQLGHLDPY